MTTSRPSPAPRTLLLLACFFVSGTCELVHETAWTRLLRLVTGNTTLAVTTVLAVFMTGLALGSLVAGRWVERRQDPIRVFGWLEAAIGVSCLVVPFAIGALEPVYGAVYRATGGSPISQSVARVLFCSVVLLPTATLMGATLPVLVRFFVAGDESSGRAVGFPVGRLYAIHTLGAALGAAGAGFVLMPSLGLRGTILVASLGNLSVAGAAMILHARTAPTSVDRLPQDVEQPSSRPRRGLSLVLLGFGLSGFAALAYEVVWTRVLTSIIGSSVYAFSSMLTAFILGLGFGSLVAARFADRVRRPLFALAWLEAGIAVSALFVVPLFGVLPVLGAGVIARAAGSFWGLAGTELALLIGVMIVPTALLGATFPFVVRVVAQGRGAARSTGDAYAANTLGSILGSLAAGFVLIPLIGTQWTIYLAVFVNGAVALLFASAAGSSPRAQLAWRAFPVALGAGALVLPSWDRAVMSFGAFHIALRMPEAAGSSAALAAARDEYELLSFEEGISATVAVRAAPSGALSMWINGKPDASSQGDLRAQMMAAHVPMLLHPEPKSVLIVGLASGISLAAAALHPAQELECVELLPAVVRAAELFGEQNRHVLADPRVEVRVADGRNHLALSGRRYDVVVSYPTNPWIAGVSDLYTLEYFELCRAALAAGGLCCVWFERYSVDTRGFESVVRTFRQVFPSMTVWNPLDADYLLVGAESELAVDVDVLAARLAQDALAQDLERAGVVDVTSFLAGLVMGAEAAGRFAHAAPLHTDDNALLEFTSPRVVARNAGDDALFRSIEAHRAAELDFLVGADAARLDAVRLAAVRAIEARGHVARALHHIANGRGEEATLQMIEAARVNPADTTVRRTVAQGLDGARALIAAGELERGIATFRTFLEIDPGQLRAHLELGVLFERLGRYGEALPHFVRAHEGDPDGLPALERLAHLLAVDPLEARRDPPRALALATRAGELSEHPDPFLARTLALAQAANGDFAGALDTLGRAERLAREHSMDELVRELAELRIEFLAGRAWTLGGGR